MSDDLPPAAPPPDRPPHWSAAPLEYARPVVRGTNTDTVFHNLAKVSWLAPLVVFAVGCLNSVVSDGSGLDPTTRRAIAFAVILIILIGLTCAIVALCAIRWCGKRGLLWPAIWGLVLNGLWVAAITSLLVPASLRARTAARTPALPAPAPVTSPKSALRQAGWMGYSIDAKYSLGAVAMDDLNVDTQNLKAQFGRDVSVLVIWADNRANASPITVSTDGATLRMADGSVVNALRTREVLETAKVDRQAFVARFSSPFTVSAGGVVEGQLLFIPPGTDLSRVQAIYLSVDGVRVSIPGRIFSAAEKAERMNRKSTPQQDPSNL